MLTNGNVSLGLQIRLQEWSPFATSANLADEVKAIKPNVNVHKHVWL